MARRSALGFHTSSAVQFSIARMAMLWWIPPRAAAAITCANGAVPSGRTASLAALMTASIG
eukprot:9694359-Lingulodinium_polyedra.AAC.1